MTIYYVSLHDMPLPYVRQTNNRPSLVDSSLLFQQSSLIFSTPSYAWLPRRFVFLSLFFLLSLSACSCPPFFFFWVYVMSALHLGWRTLYPLVFCLEVPFGVGAS